MSFTRTEKIGAIILVVLLLALIAVQGPAGIGALTLSASSIINMGSGSSIIAFAGSSAQTWTGTLSIYNWSGTPVTGGGTDQGAGGRGDFRGFWGNDADARHLAAFEDFQLVAHGGRPRGDSLAAGRPASPGREQHFTISALGGLRARAREILSAPRLRAGAPRTQSASRP